MSSIFLIIFIGILFGIFTGLLPGIHVNLIATLVLINLNYLTKFTTDYYLIIFVISMSITHTFIDFLPNVFLMIPDSDNSLALLPAQQLLMKGKALESVFISGLGSLVGSISGIILIPLFYKYIDIIYNFFDDYIKSILIFVVLIFILQEKGTKRFWAIIVVVFGGILGLFALNSYFLNYKLTVIFTGLFGAPSLIIACFSNSTIPKQETNFNTKLNKNYLSVTILSSIISFFTALFPGITNAQAISILSLFFKKITSKIFIFATSIINTLNFVFSLIVFMKISKVRNGVVSTINVLDLELGFEFLKIYPLLVLGISFISFFILLLLAYFFVKIYNKFKIQESFFLTLFFLLIFMVIKMSGFYGLIYFFASFFLGLFVCFINIRRINLMSVLIIPIIFFI